MITGDKPETAVAISNMCSLLRPEHHLEKIVGLTGPDLRYYSTVLMSIYIKMYLLPCND